MHFQEDVMWNFYNIHVSELHLHSEFETNEYMFTYMWFYDLNTSGNISKFK